MVWVQLRLDSVWVNRGLLADQQNLNSAFPRNRGKLVSVGKSHYFPCLCPADNDLQQWTQASLQQIQVPMPPPRRCWTVPHSPNTCEHTHTCKERQSWQFDPINPSFYPQSGIVQGFSLCPCLHRWLNSEINNQNFLGGETLLWYHSFILPLPQRGNPGGTQCFGGHLLQHPCNNWSCRRRAADGF